MDSFETALTVRKDAYGDNWYTEARVADLLGGGMKITLVGAGLKPSESLADFTRQLGEYLDNALTREAPPNG